MRGGSEFIVSSRESLTYRDVNMRVNRLSDRLREFSRGPMALVANDPVESIIFLLASCQVGIECCLYPADRDMDFYTECASAFGHMLLERDHGGELFVVGSPSSDLPPTRQSPSPVGEPRVAVMTSGTTGKPKATRHHWKNLVASAAQGARARSDRMERWLLAYNVNQYAGLQVLAHVAISGGTLVVPDRISATAGIEAIVAYQVTHVSATPTFWRLALGVMERRGNPEIDLVQITIGGEAVSDALLGSLKERFSRTRISHIYATSEIGSSVAVTDGKAGLPLSILERGSAHPVHFRIDDGQLLALSDVGMIGYHDSVKGAQEWIQTGDLVEIRNERIRFIGRVGNVINVGGVKVHPLAVEDVIALVAGVELAHVYGRANPITGSIVAADVIARQDWDVEIVRKDIATACSSLPEAHRPRIVKFVESLPMVQNKLDRRKL